jgi:predicted DNA-binding transcriptional regulator AlpA
MSESNALPNALSHQQILTVTQTATLLGVSVPTVRRLRKTKKLPQPIRLSERRIGWRAADLIEHIAAAKAA